MANLVFNIAKGKAATYFTNVDAGSPANSRIIVVLLNITGGASAEDGPLRDADTMAAIEALSNVAESTNTGYARKTLAGGDVSAVVDDTNDWFNTDISDQTWTGVTNTGTGAIMKLVTLYDADNTAGTDSDLIPLTAHDFAVTPDGSDITAVIAAAGLFRAQ